MRRNSLTFKVFMAIVLNDVGDCIAQLLMKKGLVQTMAGLMNFGNVIEFIVHNAGSWLLWTGILVYALNFFVWIVVLSHVDLSIALPVGSTSYIFIPILATLFLHEHVGWIRWIGIGLVILGIHFVSKSARQQVIKTPKKL